MHKTNIHIGVILLLTGIGAKAQLVQLDLSGAYNYDNFISLAEQAEADSYNPPTDWGMTRRYVPQVFGEHGYDPMPFNGQDSSTTNLPDDGIINQGTWTYQLNTTLDAEPGGGWGGPEYAMPTTPTGLLPLAQNVVRTFSPHTGTANPPEATVSIPFLPGEQGMYSEINMLFTSSNDEFTVFADYSDGQEALWTGFAPAASGSLDTGTYASHADLESAITTTDQWGNGGDRSIIRSGTRNMWHFTNGLTLDPGRTLEGITIGTTPDNWNSRNVITYAVTGMAAVAPVPELSSLLLTLSALSLGLVTLRKKR